MTFRSNSFDFVAKKDTISTQEDIKRDEEIIGFTVPELYFGNNSFSVKCENFELSFNAVGALLTVDKKVNFKVKNEWTESKYAVQAIKPFDWTYLAFYRGKITGNHVITFDDKQNNTFLPIERLSREDPILYFDKIDLFEDEFSDNGKSHLDIKCRCMSYGWFILLRQFIRIDHVIYIMRDTRIFHEYGTDEILREFIHKEIHWDEIGKLVEDISEYVPYPQNIVQDGVPGNFVIQERIKMLK